MNKKLGLSVFAAAIVGAAGCLALEQDRSVLIERTASVLIENARSKGVEIGSWSVDKASDALLLDAVRATDAATGSTLTVGKARVEFNQTMTSVPRMVLEQGVFSLKIADEPVDIRFERAVGNDVSIAALMTGEATMKRTFVTALRIEDEEEEFRVNSLVLDGVDRNLPRHVELSGVRLQDHLIIGSTAAAPRNQIDIGSISADFDTDSLRRALDKPVDTWDASDNALLRSFAVWDVFYRLNNSAPSSIRHVGYTGKLDPEGYPTTFDFRLDDMSAAASTIGDPGMQHILNLAGFEKLEFSVRVAGQMNRDARTITINPAEFTLRDNFSVTATASLGDVVLPEKTQTFNQSPDASLAGLSMTMTDKSFLSKIVRQGSRMGRMSEQEVRTTLAKGVAVQGAQYGLDQASIEAWSKFVQSDGGSLKVDITPAAKLPLSEIFDEGSDVDLRDAFSPKFSFEPQAK